jgi:uncharacterized protein (TIGR00251 family)
MGLRVDEGNGWCAFRVHVTPRSRQNEVVGIHGDALKVRVVAAPVRGKANRALELFLAERLGVVAEAVQIVSGLTSRQKRVQVTGVSAVHIQSVFAMSKGHGGA